MRWLNAHRTLVPAVPPIKSPFLVRQLNGNSCYARPVGGQDFIETMSFNVHGVRGAEKVVAGAERKDKKLAHLATVFNEWR